MKALKLHLEGFINPIYLKKIQGFGIIEVEVNEDGKVFIEGYKWSFVKGEELKPGTKLMFWFSNSGYAYEYSAYKKHQKIQEESRINQKQLQIQKLDNLRDVANDFYSHYSIPFDFNCAIKDNLSGLSEKSLGNGTKKNSVIHIILLGDYKSEKISRKKGNFLCTQSKSKYGANWAGAKEDGIFFNDSKRNSYKPIPTCKKCLEILKRFENE